MKPILIFCLIACSLQGLAQAIYSKDNIYIGEREEFIVECVQGASEELVNFEGIEVKKERYCECVCDNLLPQVLYSELEAAIESDDIIGFLLNENNLPLIMECVEGNVEVSGDFKYTEESINEETLQIAIYTCKSEILNDEEAMQVFTEQSAEAFCVCAMESLMAKGFTYDQILQAENEDSEAFNEIVLPCMMSVLDDSSLSISEQSVYNPEDILGDVPTSFVPLVDYLGTGYKVKISFNGEQKYFLLDTGASDMLISSELERTLIFNGTIHQEDYAGEQEYTLANGQAVIARLVWLNNVTIGDYTVNNVLVGVIDNGSLLCGKSFLDKFYQWEIDKNKKELVLHK